MAPLVVGDIRLPMRLALTSIAHGYQIMGVPSRSGSLVLGGAAHRNSEDESVDAKEVDAT